MSERDVAGKVGELMRTLDDVKKYTELAHAMTDFAGIIVASLIAVVALVIFQNAVDILAGPQSNDGLGFSLSYSQFPMNPIVGFVLVLVPILGTIYGIFYVTRRVAHVKVGDWEDTLKEGVPGAVKLLSETDWDSLLSAVSLSKAAFLLYALIRVAVYSILTFIIMLIFGIGGIWFLVSLGPAYLAVLSVVVALLLSSGKMVSGFRRLQSLDGLFWDLRWFYSEFKRANFNQA